MEFYLFLRIMAIFNFFGDNEHRVFNYKPIYFDKEAEERRRMFGAVDGRSDKEKKDGTYVPGSFIKGSLRDGAYKETREHMKKTQTAIGLVALILIAVMLVLIAKYYTLFFS